MIVGSSGRGKTSTARLLGVISGYSIEEVRRAVQHGQPQMSIADLLGRPSQAGDSDTMKIAWRQWLGMRVKIIDDYNRIPSDTQAALMTVMSDNHAELLDQVYNCPEAAWFLTADEPGGVGADGLYRIAGNLGDRVDVVVKAFHFNMRFLNDLLSRLEQGFRAEDRVPPEIIFSEIDIDRMNSDLMKVELREDVRKRLEYFFSQFEHCELAGGSLEYQTKETVRLSGGSVAKVFDQQVNTTRRSRPGFQTHNGLSVRTIVTCLTFLKAMAYFRGADVVSLGDARAILPLMLHDKLLPITDSAFFKEPQNETLQCDRVGWIRRMWDMANQDYEESGRDKRDPLEGMEHEFSLGLEGLSEDEAQKRITHIEMQLKEIADKRDVYGPLVDDVLKLKYLHQRYMNYLRWLKWIS